MQDDGSAPVGGGRSTVSTYTGLNTDIDTHTLLTIYPEVILFLIVLFFFVFNSLISIWFGRPHPNVKVQCSLAYSIEKQLQTIMKDKQCEMPWCTLLCSCKASHYKIALILPRLPWNLITFQKSDSYGSWKPVLHLQYSFDSLKDAVQDWQKKSCINLFSFSRYPHPSHPNPDSYIFKQRCNKNSIYYFNKPGLGLQISRDILYVCMQ